MGLRLLKTAVIKYLPSGLVRKLRYQRRVVEWVYNALYYIGVRQDLFYPYFLKRKAKKTGVSTRDSKNLHHRWGEAFCSYNSDPNRKTINLMWADGPIPGNYGDWLSPYIVTKLCEVNVLHLNEVGNYKKKHLVALGSIISLVNEHAVVVGAGICAETDSINIGSTFISVRGPYTDKRILELGGQKCHTYGDIGFLLSRVYKPKKAPRKKSIVVVRHIQHADLSLELDDRFREISIHCTRPEDIESFIDELHSAEFVATSAMHCFITCISYSIPCVLFSMGDWKNKVPGDGVKYKDALAGVGLTQITPIGIDVADDFCKIIISAPKYKEAVSSEALDGIESALKKAIKYCEQ